MAEIVEKPKSFNATAKDIARRFFRHENAVLAAILVIIIAMLAVISKGRTVTVGNISNIWLQSSIRGIAAVGELFVVLVGGIDIAVGGIALLTCLLYTSPSPRDQRGSRMPSSA